MSSSSEAVGPDTSQQEDWLDVVVHIDRSLDLQLQLQLERRTTIGALKQRLADADPTAQAGPSTIGLRLAGQPESLPLDDQELVPEFGELELCSPSSSSAAAAAARACGGCRAYVPSDVGAEAEDGIWYCRACWESWQHRQTPPAAAAEPSGPPRVDVVTLEGRYGGLEVPEGCTVARWRQLLDSGALLGDKVLWASKLRCQLLEGDGAFGPQLDGEVPLPLHPAAVAVAGPDSVLRMLGIALRKKLGEPDAGRCLQRASQASSASPKLPLELGGRDQHLEFFFLGLQAGREHMEDRACALLSLPGYEQAALFGVFDGHGGDQVSELVSRHLPDILVAELKQRCRQATAPEQAAEAALKEAFSIADRSLRDALQPHQRTFDLVGTTAVVVLLLRSAVGRRFCLCANAGDSRAVLCRGGDTVALSEDHKPTEPEERRRIEAAGGHVGMTGRIESRGAGTGLNLSRALGDFAYKARGGSPDEQLVIARPDVLKVELEETDEFVALASDGVFDAFSSEELVGQLRGSLANGVSVEQAVRRTLSNQFADNVTLCLVKLQSVD